MTENQLISYLEQAGFYGVQILEKTFWKSVENINFYSVSVRAHKFKGSGQCLFNGQKAVYKGPFRVIIDDEGHVFPRNEKVEICSDTAVKLSRAPYKDHFRIYDSDNSDQVSRCSTVSNSTVNKTSCC